MRVFEKAASRFLKKFQFGGPVWSYDACHSNPWCAELQNACGAQAIAWIRCAPNPGLTHTALRAFFVRSLAGCEYVPQVHYLAGGTFNPLKAGLA